MLPGSTPGNGAGAGVPELSAVVDVGGSSSACLACFWLDAVGAPNEQAAKSEPDPVTRSATMRKRMGKTARKLSVV
jgi:hypothetical protein